MAALLVTDQLFDLKAEFDAAGRSRPARRPRRAGMAPADGGGGGRRRRSSGKTHRGYCGQARTCLHYVVEGCCAVRQAALSLGPITYYSRELSLPGPWSRYMAPTCLGRSQRIANTPTAKRHLPLLRLRSDDRPRRIPPDQDEARAKAKLKREEAAAAGGLAAAEAVSERVAELLA